MIKYLHIGCGANILPKPFKNLDIRKKKGVDFVGAAYPLKFKSNSFDLVYASHVLEHFKKKDTLKVLKDWVRVLKPGGTIRISVPCIDNLIKIYKYDNEIENVKASIEGAEDSLKHKWNPVEVDAGKIIEYPHGRSLDADM